MFPQRCKDILEAEGIRIRLRAECISFAQLGADIAVGVDCESGDREVVGSHALLAVGRRPNTDDLGLDRAGIETDKLGYIMVDDQLRTNVPGVWALGDCNGKGAFTHTSYNDFEIVAANLLDGDRRRISDRLPTYALYVDPPLGRAGMTEAEARHFGKRILVGTRPMTRVARAIEKGETQGFIKIVVDADTQADSRGRHPRRRRRRGRPRHSRYHVCKGALHDASACRAHTSDRFGAHSHYPG